ncbi:protein madd-4 isoform X3 [Leptopilina boulardi]|uniref:protein madd-4 isoform X3 n=1 Tax=Leptopilina boulardi TaxID=63433 RepID=UPI0021F5F775|nr:protein madd-4 isoform X3 [Leptopilina boulardi]
MTRLSWHLDRALPQNRGIRMRYLLLAICLLGFAISDNSTYEGGTEVAYTETEFEPFTTSQGLPWGEWSPCTRRCDGGISRQQRRCRKKPCKGKSWSVKYKLCNTQPCDIPTNYRAEQCEAFNNVPYGGQLLKWYPYYDSTRLCSLICRGEQSLDDVSNNNKDEKLLAGRTESSEEEYSTSVDSEETIIVQLAEKVKDGTRCRPESLDVCIGGECVKVGCDLRIGSNKKTDVCGVCGGNGSSCHGRYSWVLEPASACTESCGGGYKIARAICKSTGPDETETDEANCDPNIKPEKVLMPCNTHSCTTKWTTNEYGKCSASCGGGSRSRAVFCIEEIGNETTKLPDYKCSATHKPRYQETCNEFSCPTWETGQWSDCSVSCGTGIRTRSVECRDGNGRFSEDCDSAERPHGEQECKGSHLCSSYDDDINQPLMQPYAPPPVPEKLIDQPVPSESTFIAEAWSPCSVTCGEGIRRREVRCKIFLEFSKTIANLPDYQCKGPKPIDSEKCIMDSCNLMENSLSYRIDAVGDSSYAEPSLTDTYRSSSSSSSGSGSYESNIKVASGSSVQTTYSWHENGFTHCSATCLGGRQTSIVQCRRDDTNKVVSNLLCTPETKPESRIKICNDHPCPPKWNTTDFSPCMSPCGIGIQTRDVTCIHEVTRGTGNTVAVPSHMCPQPPPVDRRYCNVFDCPVKWHAGEWGKCSKTCGGGIKTRKVTCEQVRAQGHKQSRPDHECPSRKPQSEKLCNDRPCSELGMSEQPIINSQNITFNQQDPNEKVDLKIGGTAVIFQGTPVIKIRCPVQNFEKAQIIWTKDRTELRKSRKYKISRKGALRLMDIAYTDKGIYSCIAGPIHAEMHLLVKLRPRDQMSSEEVLRSGNAIQTRQGTNSKSSAGNSNENVHSDRAEPAFIYGSDDHSHEARHEIYGSNSKDKARKKTTQKPKIRTTPTTTRSTKMNEEYSVTSPYKPGFESIESNAKSSASTLVPHFNQLISTLKTLWPFKDTSKSINQKPLLDINFQDNPTTRAMSKLKSDFQYDNLNQKYDEIEKNTLNENDANNNNPYDINDELINLNHKNTIKQELDETIHTTPTILLQILTNVSKQKKAYDNHLGKDRATFFDKSKNNSENINKIVTIPIEIDKITKNWTKNFEIITETTTIVDEKNIKTENNDETLNKTKIISFSENPFIEEITTNISEKNNEFYEEELQIEKHFHHEHVFNNDTLNTIKNETNDDELEKPLIENFEEEKELEVLRRSKFNDEGNNNFSKSNEKEEKSKSTKNISLQISGSEDPLHQPTIGPVVVFSKAAKDDLIFEWVTTEWSRCSQTCGGGGFQMRGAQCTVRSAKQLTNTTRNPQRTVIGANLCEDAGYPVPEKVKSCGTGRCPQWHAEEWTSCENSRCFNWKTAMQKRDITCRVIFEIENGTENETIVNSSQCDEGIKPPQRQECYNDACKGVWRVGEWSECSAPCEEDGIKYRILQCVWFGTKKPAGNACRDLSRPPVMKTCRGPTCLRSPEDCKDLSQLCNRVKTMNMCQEPLYKKQCCSSCMKREKGV